MPNLIDNGDTDREELVVFVKKHLPYNLYEYDVTETTKDWWQTEPVIGKGFALKDGDEESEDDIDVAEIQLADPNTIIVYDRSFLEDITELAAKYERYNPNVAVIVIVKKSKTEQ